MPSGRVREVTSEAMLTALDSTLTVDHAAEALTCSAPTLFNRAKTDPSVSAAISAQHHKREEMLAEAIYEHRGVLSKVARTVGLGSGSSVRYHIARSPRLKQVFADARERVVDTAEDNVFTAIDDGNLSFSWKLLQTLGKDRGYTERKEIDQHVTHSLDHTSTNALVSMLEQVANGAPDVLEAEFREMGDEDRGFLLKALERQVPQETEEVRNA
jgi:hypothetical protein